MSWIMTYESFAGELQADRTIKIIYDFYKEEKKKGMDPFKKGRYLGAMESYLLFKGIVIVGQNLEEQFQSIPVKRGFGKMEIRKETYEEFILRKIEEALKDELTIKKNIK